MTAGLSKVVFSSTLREPLAWPNTQLIARDAVEAVREMKDKGSRSMRTMGSLSLCRSLLKAGLVDRFRVVIFPVITGATGRERIYDGYPDVALDMISSRTFDGRAASRSCSRSGRKMVPNPLTLGSTELVHALLAKDLVDAMTILTFLVVLGGGKKFFADGSAPAHTS